MAKIIKVVGHEHYTWMVYDVVYESGAIRTYRERGLPKTAREFMAKASNTRFRHSLLYNRDQVVYEA